jgi:hypothetical protein
MALQLNRKGEGMEERQKIRSYEDKRFRKS